MVKNGSCGLSVIGIEAGGQRLVRDLEERVLEEEADGDREDQEDAAEDDPRAQLVEVLDQRHALVELGGLDRVRLGHGSAPGARSAGHEEP